MDFFDMNFSELFAEKHGKNLFNNISNQITLENPNNDNNQINIEIVFKVAFLDFFGLDKFTIQTLIKDTMLEQDINVKQIKLIHNNSIKKIQKYLQSAIDEMGTEK